MKDRIKSKLSYLYKPRKRKKIESNLEDILFNLYDVLDKHPQNPLGYTFNISAKHRSIYINGKYAYFKEKEFNKIMKHLKRIVDFYFKYYKEKNKR